MTVHPWKVVFLDRDSISPKTTLRDLEFPHEFVVYENTTPDQVAERIAQADVIITNKVALSADQLQQAKNLKLVAAAATGTDNIDVSACTSLGVVVSNIRGYAVTTVPEHVFSLVFALKRSIVAYHQSVKAGRWQESGKVCYFDYPISDLAGSTLGIVGKGAIGQAVATIGQALGMKVLFSGRKGSTTQSGSGYVAFDELLAQSDIISLHCPLTPETRHLLDEREFSLMAKKPLIINTARGGLINHVALGDALRSGQLAGAGIDVAEVEPPPASHPLMQLLDLPNFILTPHIAWASDEAIQTLTDQLLDNIDAFYRGQPRNVVNPA